MCRREVGNVCVCDGVTCVIEINRICVIGSGSNRHVLDCFGHEK